MLQKYITIEGARVHNLKDVNVRIPRGSLCVVTGLSGIDFLRVARYNYNI